MLNSKLLEQLSYKDKIYGKQYSVSIFQNDMTDLSLFNDHDLIAIDSEWLGLDISITENCRIIQLLQNENIVIIFLDDESYAPNFLSLMNDNKYNKIFHSAKSDIVVFNMRWPNSIVLTDESPINCTRIMSHVESNAIDKCGLQHSVEKHLNIIMDKDWLHTDTTLDEGMEEARKDKLTYKYMKAEIQEGNLQMLDYLIYDVLLLEPLWTTLVEKIDNSMWEIYKLLLNIAKNSIKVESYYKHYKYWHCIIFPDMIHTNLKRKNRTK